MRAMQQGLIDAVSKTRSLSVRLWAVETRVLEREQPSTQYARLCAACSHSSWPPQGMHYKHWLWVMS